MVEIGDKLTVFFDVDNTLIYWGEYEPELTLSASNAVNLTKDGQTRMVKYHKENIENLKKHFIRGHYIVVWSAGGGNWASQAVKALGIEDFVHQTMKKPEWYYDDKNCENWMGKPLYMEDK